MRGSVSETINKEELETEADNLQARVALAGVRSGVEAKISRDDAKAIISADKVKGFDTAAMLYAMLSFSGYAIPTTGKHAISLDGKTRRDMTSPEKASTIANAFGKGMVNEADFANAGRGGSSNNQSIRIYMVDGNGYIVEKWILHNPIIKTINWGELDYAADDPVEYSIDIAYDFATMTTGNSEKISPVNKNFNEFLKKYILNTITINK